MPGHLNGPQRGDEQGHRRKQRYLTKHGQRAGKADARQLFQRAPHRPLPRARRQKHAQLRMAAGIHDHRQEHDPIDDGRRHARTRPAQRGQAQLAENEHVVAGDIDEKSHKARKHGRTHQCHAFHAAAQGDKQQIGRGPPYDGPQILPGHDAQFAFHAHLGQMKGERIDDENQGDRNGQRHPQALPHDMSHALQVLAVLDGSGPPQLRDAGGNRHEQALTEKNERNPKRSRQRHRRHIDRPHAARHDHIHKAHRDHGDLREQGGDGQRKLGAHFRKIRVTFGRHQTPQKSFPVRMKPRKGSPGLYPEPCKRQSW